MDCRRRQEAIRLGYTLHMTPTADYSCNSPKCRTEDGAAPVYELPIRSLRCPVCGSKRITRLFNKIAVLRGAQPTQDPRLTSSSHLVRSTALLRSGYDHHDATKPGYTPPGGGIEDAARYDKLKSFAMSPDEITVASPGKGQPLTPMEIMRERRVNPAGAVAILAAQQAMAVPTRVVGRDEGAG